MQDVLLPTRARFWGITLLVCALIFSISNAQPTTTTHGVGDFVAQVLGVSTATAASTAATISSITAPFQNSTGPSNSTGTNHTCPDIACASACSSSWASWSSTSANWISQNADFVSTSTIQHYNASSTIIPVAQSNGTVYATCDGIPRFSGKLAYKSTTVSNIPATSSTWYEISTKTRGNFSEPTPTCKISESQCDPLLNSWHADHYLAFPFNQSTGFYTHWPDGAPLDYPHCNDSLMTSGWGDISGCWIKGASARLLYWPEPVEADNQSCPDGTYTAPPAQTVANATGPVTKVMTFSDVYYNCCTTTVTLTSPTMYLSMEDVEGRQAQWGFAGSPIPATIIPVAPGDLKSQVIAPPLITNDALSSSAMSVIANRQTEKFTDLFGYDWHQGLEGVGGPNMPMQTVALNMADLGRPPQPLSYYFGAAGWYCMNANPFALEDQPISAGLPPGMPCDTIFNDLYRPWVQIPQTMLSAEGKAWETCNLMFGWDPPIPLTSASTIVGPTVPGGASATSTTTKQSVTRDSAVPGPSIPTSTPTAQPVSDPATTVSKSPSPAPKPVPTSTQGEDPSTPSASGGGGVSTNTGSPSPIATIGSGSSAVTVASDPSNSGQIVASSAGGATTITAGGQGTLGTQPVSVDSTGGVIVSSATTINIDPTGGQSSVESPVVTTQSNGIVTTISGQGQITPTASGVQIGSQTLTAGGSALTSDGATISALPSGSGIVIQSGGTTQTLTGGGSNSVISFGSGTGQAATVVPLPTSSGVQINGQTLTAGGSALTSNGATYSALSSGSGIVVASDGTTQTYAATGSNDVLSLGPGQSATIVPLATASAVQIDGHTLTAGGSVFSTNGATYSALPSGSGIVVISDGTTHTYTATGSNGVLSLGSGQKATVVPLTSSTGFVTTIDGQTISAISNGVVVDGSTVTEGGSARTIDGTVYSVKSNGQLVIDGSSTLGAGGLKLAALDSAIMAAASGEASATSTATASGSSGSGSASATSSAGGLPAETSSSGPGASAAQKSSADSIEISRAMFAGAVVVGLVCMML